jgi:hypothetical protein
MTPECRRQVLYFVGTLFAYLQADDIAKLGIKRPGLADAGSAYRPLTPPALQQIARQKSGAYGVYQDLSGDRLARRVCCLITGS